VGGSKGDTRLRAASVVTIAVIVLNLTTYGFTILAAHRLGPAEYGAVAALMGLLLVLNVLGLGLQTTAARRVSQAGAERAVRIHETLSVTSRLSPVLGLCCLVAAPLVQHVFHLASPLTAPFVAVTAWLQALTLGQAGVLQGERRWTPLALLYAATGVARLVGGVLGMAWRDDALGAMTGVALGAVVPVLVGWCALRKRARPPLPTGHRREILTELAHNSHALIAFLALSNADIIVARIALAAHPAGWYAGGLILTKAVLFLPQFVIVLAFPTLASGGSQRRASMRLGLLLVSFLGVAVVIGTAVLRRLALVFIGGDDYATIKPVLWQFALLGTALALLQVLVYDLVAGQDHRPVAVLWLGVAAIAAAAPIVHSTDALLHWVVAVDILATAMLAWLSARPRASSAPSPPTRPAER